MKRALSILGQTLLLLLTAVVFGIVLPGTRHSPFHVVRVLSQEGYTRQQYEFDWLIGVLVVYVVLLLIGVLSRRIRTSWISSTAALVLTVVIIGVLTRIGFKEVNLLSGGIAQAAAVAARYRST